MRFGTLHENSFVLSWRCDVPCLSGLRHGRQENVASGYA